MEKNDYEKTLQAIIMVKVIRKRTSSIGLIFSLVIEKPNKDFLSDFENATRGFRKKISKRVSMHVFPTGEAWEVHLDRTYGYGHKVMKSHQADLLLKELIQG